MNVLVTGGAGIVGQSLVQRLHSLGHRVLVVGRRTGVSVPNADYKTCD
ncbi:MAG: NAD-dependent epimerase/dehydratase family protein, partial [Spirochaetales bacterium]|nr:NAD-dependent epimerase/dehydratase family protein [Spirochaetales bacterium]